MRGLRALAGAVVTALFIYLVAAFAAWDVNPGHWSTEGRVATALFGGFLVLLAAIAAAAAE